MVSTIQMYPPSRVFLRAFVSCAKASLLLCLCRKRSVKPFPHATTNGPPLLTTYSSLTVGTAHTRPLHLGLNPIGEVMIGKGTPERLHRSSSLLECIPVPSPNPICHPPDVSIGHLLQIMVFRASVLQSTFPKCILEVGARSVRAGGSLHRTAV